MINQYKRFFTTIQILKVNELATKDFKILNINENANLK